MAKEYQLRSRKINHSRRNSQIVRRHTGYYVMQTGQPTRAFATPRAYNMHVTGIRNLLIAGATLLLAPLYAAGDTQSPPAGAWEYLRPQFYGDRAIGVVDENFMSIEAPSNTPDPAATPLTLRFGPGAAGRIRQVRLIIDNNPSPLAATMDLKSGVPMTEIDLRVRIDRFTSVRAIAETNDGRLEMRSAWVNASGGCSAPPGAAEAGTLGDIRFRPSADGKALQISIRHPNNSGFQIDPRTGDTIPPHYISHLSLSFGGQTFMEAQTGISLSENPTLRIATLEPLSGSVRIEATDSQTNAHYSGTWNGAANATAKAAPDSGH
jgi:sulfur-oxidizing protein SoxY